jgi:transposase
VRPNVPRLKVREYVYAFGAVSPQDGENFFIAAPKCNSQWAEYFFCQLSEAYPDDLILMIGDNAPWHHSGEIKLPDNVHLAFIPPYTPEMNPQEQVWASIREHFKNRFFNALDDVVDHLQKVVANLDKNFLKNLTSRDWIMGMI